MHPTGPINNHIKMSSGGDTYAMKHYCTTTENAYGSGWEHFTPRTGLHSGAGFVPNNRGQIFYTSHLDEIDNPAMGRLIKDNYKSVCHKHFIGNTLPTGRETLPFYTLYKPSGFIRERGTHIPTQKDVQKQFIDGILNKSPSNITPKHKPYLYKTYPKDPIAAENSCYVTFITRNSTHINACSQGPRYMSTEYTMQFDGKQSADLGPGTVGNREMSGFTENNKTEETLEGRPDACMCDHEYPGSCHVNNRPIGVTMYYTDYWPLVNPTGREALPNIETRAAVDNGFTKGNRAIPEFVELHPNRVYDKACDMPASKLENLKRNDPAEYANAIYCNRVPTMMNAAFQGKQIDPFDGKTFRAGVGKNEFTGHVSNEDCFVQKRDNLGRFVTHNMTKFYDHTLVGSERNGQVNGQIQDLRPNGFSRDVKIHNIEGQPDALVECTRLNPYQARSVIVRESLTTSPTKILTGAF